MEEEVREELKEGLDPPPSPSSSSPERGARPTRPFCCER